MLQRLGLKSSDSNLTAGWGPQLPSSESDSLWTALMSVSWPNVQEKSRLEVSSKISGPLRTVWKLKVPEGLVGARPWGRHFHELHKGMVVRHRI